MVINAGPIVAIGECMIELRQEAGSWGLGHGGDVFNTAHCLASLDEPVAFMTAIGNDLFSNRMRAAWAADGLDVSLVLHAPEALPGLYAVETDAAGERSFHYWRERAAVRGLFQLPGIDNALAVARQAGLLYLSGVTLAIFDGEGRAKLMAIARAVREAGGTVAFDPNFRPRLWSSSDAARAAIETFAPFISCALVTFDDATALHGDQSPGETIARWRAAGVHEVVVKLGAAGCLVADDRLIAPIAPITPLDTTGAGDAFNGGYLHARRHGCEEAQAAAFGNLVAGQVILHRGAIPPRGVLPTLTANVNYQGQPRE